MNSIIEKIEIDEAKIGKLENLVLQFIEILKIEEFKILTLPGRIFISFNLNNMDLNYIRNITKIIFNENLEAILIKDDDIIIGLVIE
ncbi:MAG: hypothetical protein QXI58_08510 [Candidatus Micrarchaeia archaeon]